MDTQVNAGSLVRTIADSEIAAVVAELVNALEEQATLLIKGFAETPPTPSRAHHFENRLGETLGEIGRQLVQWLFSQLEPPVEEMPGTVSHREHSHRRMPDKTLRENIVTRFDRQLTAAPNCSQPIAWRRRA